MRKIGTAVPLITLVLAFIGLCGTNAVAGTFTVHGTLILDDATTGEPSTSPLAEVPVKVVLREKNSGAKSEETILTSGRMSEGAISLVGEIDAVTQISILVYTEADSPLTLDAIVAPGKRVSFALLEWPTLLAFLGSLNSAIDSSKAFKISGNLSAVESDLEHATVVAQYSERGQLGEKLTTTWHVLLNNKKFEIIGEVSEPRVVNIMVYKGANFTQTNAIVEPGAEIEVETQTQQLRDLYAVDRSATETKHTLLIDSWQQSTDYQVAKQRYTRAIEEYQTALREGRTPGLTTIQRAPVVQIPTIDADDEESIEPSVAAEADECAKYAPIVVRAKPKPDSPPVEQVAEHVQRWRTLLQIRTDALETIATQAEDPLDSLLALELGAHSGKTKRQDIYDRLSRTLDIDIVRRRVTHDRNDHARFLNPQRSTTLLPGSKAPAFTLTSFAGEEVDLYDIVGDHQRVLLEFWASWCGPCIRIMPELKELHANHSSQGFEVVSISIDQIHSHWADATEEHEIPWINLAELQRESTEVAKRYNVKYIPKNYLLDTNGCIVRTNVPMTKLKEILNESERVRSTNDGLNRTSTNDPL